MGSPKGLQPLSQPLSPSRSEVYQYENLPQNRVSVVQRYGPSFDDDTEAVLASFLPRLRLGALSMNFLAGLLLAQLLAYPYRCVSTAPPKDGKPSFPFLFKVPTFCFPLFCGDFRQAKESDPHPKHGSNLETSMGPLLDSRGNTGHPTMTSRCRSGDLPHRFPTMSFGFPPFRPALLSRIDLAETAFGGDLSTSLFLPFHRVTFSDFFVSFLARGCISPALQRDSPHPAVQN